jgi:hypothetical protein
LNEDLNVKTIRESIFKTLPYIKDKERAKLFEGLAVNVDWSVALDSLLRELNDYYQSECSQESS